MKFWQSYFLGISDLHAPLLLFPIFPLLYFYCISPLLIGSGWESWTSIFDLFLFIPFCRQETAIVDNICLFGVSGRFVRPSAPTIFELLVFLLLPAICGGGKCLPWFPLLLMSTSLWSSIDLVQGALGHSIVCQFLNVLTEAPLQVILFLHPS